MLRKPASSPIKIVSLTGGTFDVSRQGKTLGNFGSEGEAMQFAEQVADALDPRPRILRPRQ